MANNIITARITIEGVRPLLQHAFGPEALSQEKHEKSGSAGNDPTEWRRTCMITPNGQLYVTSMYIFSLLREAGKHTKRGRATLQGAVSSTLQVITDPVLIDRFFPGYPANGTVFDAGKVDPPPTNQSAPVFLSVMGCRNPATRGRNVRYRIGCSAGWKANFLISWDKTVVAREQMNAIAIDAGTLVGLADGRALGFGRFTVTEFTIIE